MCHLLILESERLSSHPACVPDYWICNWDQRPAVRRRLLEVAAAATEHGWGRRKAQGARGLMHIAQIGAIDVEGTSTVCIAQMMLGRTLQVPPHSLISPHPHVVQARPLASSTVTIGSPQAHPSHKQQVTQSGPQSPSPCLACTITCSVYMINHSWQLQY